MHDDPDQLLVLKAQAGDASAYGELCRKYYNLVYTLAYGVLNRREDAQDVAQEVLIKVQRDLFKFKGDSKFKTWLYRVSVNAAIDAARRRKQTVALEDVDDFLASKAVSPLRAASQSELKERMQAALQKLSEDHRAVLVLREWEELSYEEIAAALQVEIGTVMSRLHYARKALANMLGIEEQQTKTVE